MGSQQGRSRGGQETRTDTKEQGERWAVCCSPPPGGCCGASPAPHPPPFTVTCETPEGEVPSPAWSHGGMPQKALGRHLCPEAPAADTPLPFPSRSLSLLPTCFHIICFLSQSCPHVPGRLSLPCPQTQAHGRLGSAACSVGPGGRGGVQASSSFWGGLKMAGEGLEVKVAAGTAVSISLCPRWKGCLAQAQLI